MTEKKTILQVVKNNKSAIILALLLISIGLNIFQFRKPSSTTEQDSFLKEVKQYVLADQKRSDSTIQALHEMQDKLLKLDKRLTQRDQENEVAKSENQKRYEALAHYTDLSNDSIRQLFARK